MLRTESRLVRCKTSALPAVLSSTVAPAPHMDPLLTWPRSRKGLTLSLINHTAQANTNLGF